jgi:Flp pilus assembly protein TadG
MMRRYPSRHPGTQRPGRTLVMFVMLTPVLLGMVGLTIDGGLMLAVYRQTQNAADAAATAAAYDLFNGLSSGTAKTTGGNYVTGQSYSNLSGANVTINIPPLSGPHAGAGNTTYAEAIISYPFQTSFIQVLGVNASQSITARSVAGYHLSPPVEGILTLAQNPSGGKGLTVSGGGTLTVEGPVVDNSTDSHQALDVSSGSTLTATKVSVSGGSDASASAVQNANNPPGGNLTPLTNTGVNYADPLSTLAVPTTSNGVTNTNYGTLSGSPLTLQSSGGTPQDVTVNNGQTVTLQPGIYKSITVQGGGSAVFTSGIYVLAGGGMTISGSSTVSNTTGGVMFYNTFSNYNATTGVDGSGGSFGQITISGGSAFNLAGLSSTANSTYSAMLLFQDRSNSQNITVSGGSTSGFSGTFYAPTAQLTVSGGSTFNSQFIVGSMVLSGGGTNVKIDPPQSQSNLVYLVE